MIKLSYWKWFFLGSGFKAGFRRIFNCWLIFHVGVGFLVAYLTPLTLKECADAVLLPLAGILVGLSFAWAGNAQALLESNELENLSKHHKGGFEEYVFTYQTAILTIIVTLVLWSFAGLNIFDEKISETMKETFKLYFLIKSTLFAFASLTIRECWHVIMGTQWMLLVRKELKNLPK